MGATQELASFVATTPFEALPSPFLHEARRCFLDWLGLTLGGHREPGTESLVRLCQQLGGNPTATVLGWGLKTSPLQAALANGYASHVLDYDDTHLPTVLHASTAIFPAALALGEMQHASGKELLRAYVLGYEVAARVALAVNPWHYDVGWHVTGTAGTLGAVAAAGALLGLNEEAMAWALGMAATQAAGLREMFGTMSKALHAAKAAHNGLLAALLAAEGMDASPRALEAPRGYCYVLSPERELGRLTQGLGETWELAHNGFKPYPCGLVTHPVIEAALQLRREHGLLPEQVEALQARTHPLVLELTGKAEPRSSLEGKFSVYHCAAVALLDGAAYLPQFSKERVRAPEVAAFRRKVHILTDPTLEKDEALITALLKDGRRIEVHIRHASGSPQNPLTDAQLQEKFRALVEPWLGPAKAQRLMALAQELDSVPDVAVLPHACTVEAAPFGSEAPFSATKR